MGTCFLYGNGGSGATGDTLTVVAPVNTTVTISKDEKSKTKNVGSDGTAVFKGLTTGKWEITIANGGKTNKDEIQINTDYKKSLNFTNIYGIYRDITSSSPAWNREDNSVGKNATATFGSSVGNSDFSSCYPWSGIQREKLSTGDVMVKIPKFWFRRYRDGKIEHIKIADGPHEGFTLHPAFNHDGVEVDCLYVGAYKTSSNNKSVTGAAPTVSQTRATMRTNAKAKGDGWGLIDIAAVSAIQMLILVEFATYNSQEAIGMGYCSGSAKLNTGSCNNVANLTGTTSDTNAKTVDVVWRGIEGFWGNICEFVDGINCDYGKYYVCNSPALYGDNIYDGYDLISFFSSMQNGSSNFITQEGLDDDNAHIFLPSSAANGTKTTYVCDDCWIASVRGIYIRGGYYNNDVYAGLFTCYTNFGSTTKTAYCGSRLQYIPQ